MKNTLLYIFIFFSIIYVVNAQDLSPKKGNISFEGKKINCWKIRLDPDESSLKKAWKDYMKNNFNVKLKNLNLFDTKPVIKAKDVIIEKIASKRINFFTRILDYNGQSEMAVFISYGYDNYVDKNTEEFKNLEGLITDFLKVYLPKYYDGKIQEINHKINSLVSKSESINQNIQLNKEKINLLEQENINLEKQKEANNLNMSYTKQEFLKREEKKNQIDELLKKL